MLHKVSTCKASDLFAILVGRESSVTRLVLRDLVIGEGGVCVDHGVLELDDTSNSVMAELDDLLEVGVRLKLELIPWVEGVQLGHEFLEEGLSCDRVVVLIMRYNSLG